MTEILTRIPPLTKFERLLLAVALQRIGDEQQHIRGLGSHITKLAAKLDLDDDLAERARAWLNSSRKINPALRAEGPAFRPPQPTTAPEKP